MRTTLKIPDNLDTQDGPQLDLQAASVATVTAQPVPPAKPEPMIAPGDLIGRAYVQRIAGPRVAASGRCRIPMLLEHEATVRPGTILDLQASSTDGGGRAVAIAGPDLRWPARRWWDVEGCFGPSSDQRLQVDLRADIAPPAQLVMPASVQSMLANLRGTMFAGQDGAAPVASVSFGWRPLWTTSRSFAARLQGRHSLGLWFRLDVEGWSGEHGLRFALRVGLSDDTEPDLLYLDELSIDFELVGGAVLVDYDLSRGFQIDQHYNALLPTDGGMRGQPEDPPRATLLLLDRGLIGDGQAPVVTGRLLPVGDRDALDLVGPLPEILGDGWQQAWPPVSSCSRRQTARFAAESWPLLPQRAGLFAIGPHGCAERPGVAGDQPDFGVHRLERVVRQSDPLGLLAVRFSVLQEGCRPMFPVEANLDPVTAAAHPRWLCWKHRTHYAWDDIDRLGKRRGDCLAAYSQRGGDRWDGHDPEHESINYLAGLYLLTADPVVRQNLDAWAESALAQYPIASQSYLDGIGAPRAYGRAQLALLLAYQVTGRLDLLDRAQGRFAHNYRQQAVSAAQLQGLAGLRTLGWDDHSAEAPVHRPMGLVELVWSDAEGCLVPVDMMEDAADPESADLPRELMPDTMAESGRLVGAEVELQQLVDGELYCTTLFAPEPPALPEVTWSPWQEAFAVAANALLWLLTGDQVAREAARRGARTVILHGTHRREDGTYAHGGYLAWNGGQPLSAEDWANPRRAQLYGDQFYRWMLPAAEVCRYFVETDGDGAATQYLAEYFAWSDQQDQLQPGARTPWEGFSSFHVRALQRDTMDAGRRAEH